MIVRVQWLFVGIVAMVPLVAQSQSGNIKFSGNISVGGTPFTGGFTYSPISYGASTEFKMTQGNLGAGWPSNSTWPAGCPAATMPRIGYQNAYWDSNAGTAFLLPWSIPNPNKGSGLGCVAPHGAIAMFTPATGSFNSNNNGQWAVKDMDADAPFAANGCAPTVTSTPCPHSFNSYWIVDWLGATHHRLYMLPDIKAGLNCVFPMMVTSNGAAGLSVNYLNCGASPGPNITAGKFGWSTGACDGVKYCYANPTNTNTTVLQKDVTVDSDSSLSTSGWTTFSPVNCGAGVSGPDGLAGFTGSLGSAMVPQQATGAGRYFFSIPTSSNETLAIFDSGASQGNVFAGCGHWSGLVLTNLNTPGHPSLVGAAVSKITGFAGAVVVTTNNDTNAGTVYLYMIPWSYQGGGGNQSSLVVRVQVGHYSSGTFVYDFNASSPSTIFNAFDLNTLCPNNPTWRSNSLGACTHTDRGGSQPVVGGFQLGFTTKNGNVLLTQANGLFIAIHNPNNAINDPAGWTLINRDPNYADNSYGAAYDSSGNGTLYPGSYELPAAGNSSNSIAIKIPLNSGVQ